MKLDPILFDVLCKNPEYKVYKERSTQHWGYQHLEHVVDSRFQIRIETFRDEKKQKVTRVAYFFNNSLHTDGSPAVHLFDSLGNLTTQKYYRFGDLGRLDDGPTVEMWHANGVRKFAAYRFDSFFSKDPYYHRDIEKGPAIQEWNDDGSLKKETYIVFGKRKRVNVKH